MKIKHFSEKGEGGDERLIDELPLTSEEVAEMLRVTPRTILNLADEGKLPGAFRVGKQWRFSRSKLREYMQQPPQESKDSTQ